MNVTRFTAAAAALGAAATLVLAPPAAAAREHCTAWAAMPARVSLHTPHVTVRTVLRGGPGCAARHTDNGATADLVHPGGAREFLRYDHFGSVQTVAIYVDLFRAGRYRATNGDVEIYDKGAEQIPSTWQVTSMVVKRTALVKRPTVSGGVLSARVLVYTKYGWTGYGDRAVTVQRSTASGWRTVGTTHTGQEGFVRTPASASYTYRLVVAATSTVWGAAATTHG